MFGQMQGAREKQGQVGVHLGEHPCPSCGRSLDPGGEQSPEQRRRRPRALAAPRPPHLSPFLPRCIPAGRLARWGGPRDFLGSTLTARGSGGYTLRPSQEGNYRGWGDLCLRRDDRRPEAGVWLT